MTYGCFPVIFHFFLLLTLLDEAEFSLFSCQRAPLVLNISNVEEIEDA